MSSGQPEPARSSEPPDRRPAVRCIPVESLLQGGREVVILHGTEEYHLRLTRKGRLILTK